MMQRMVLRWVIAETKRTLRGGTQIGTSLLAPVTCKQNDIAGRAGG